MRISKAFTLAEVAVVLVIVGIIIGIATPAAFNSLVSSRGETSSNNLKIIEEAKRQFSIDHPWLAQVPDTNALSAYLKYGVPQPAHGADEIYENVLDLTKLTTSSVNGVPGYEPRGNWAGQDISRNGYNDLGPEAQPILQADPGSVTESTLPSGNEKWINVGQFVQQVPLTLASEGAGQVVASVMLTNNAGVLTETVLQSPTNVTVPSGTLISSYYGSATAPDSLYRWENVGIPNPPDKTIQGSSFTMGGAAVTLKAVFTDSSNGEEYVKSVPATISVARRAPFTLTGTHTDRITQGFSWTIPPEVPGGEATTKAAVNGQPEVFTSFDRPGNYLYQVRGGTAGGVFYTADSTVTVTNAIPVVSIVNAPASDVIEGTPYALTAEVSDEDQGDQNFSWTWWVDGVALDLQGGKQNVYNDLNNRIVPEGAERLEVLYQVSARDPEGGQSEMVSYTVNIVRPEPPAPVAVVDAAAVMAPEGGRVTFNITLSGRPGSAGAEVRVSDYVAKAGEDIGDPDTDISFTPETLRFTDSDWSVPQVVTVNAEEDADVENGVRVLGITSPGDAAGVRVNVTEEDNDTTIELQAYPPEAGTLDGGGVVTKGEWDDIATTPQPGFAFVEWNLDSGDGEIEDPSTTDTRARATESTILVASYDACPPPSAVGSLTFAPISATSVTVGWAAVSGTELYEVQLSTSSTWNAIVRQQNTPLTSISFTGLTPGVTYHARVRSLACSRYSDWSTGSFVAANPTIVVVPNALGVPEGRGGEVGVRLSAQPVSTTTVYFRGTGDSDLFALGTGEPATGTGGGAVGPTPTPRPFLNFTTNNWSVPQPLIVVAEEDADTSNGEAVFDLTSDSANSARFTATEIDNDANVEIMISPEGAGEIEWGGGVQGKGERTSVAVYPNPGYSFSGWVVEDGDIEIEEPGSSETHVTPYTDAVILAEFSICPVPSLVAPVSATAVTANTAQIGWTAVSGSVGYWLELSTSPTFSTVLRRLFLSTNSAVLNSLTSETTYYVRVRSEVCGVQGDWSNTSFIATTPSIIVDPGALTVNEGGSSSFNVRLAAAPVGTTTVNIAKAAGGDANLNASVTSLTFTTSNWSTPQAVSVSAGNDGDVENGTATFNLTAAGMTGAALVATENDKDTTLTIQSSLLGGGAGGGTTTPSGASVVLKGSTNAISAVADSGYAFVDWTWSGGGSGPASTTSPSTTIVVSSPTTVQANFLLNPTIVPSRDNFSVNEGTTGTFSVKLSSRPAGTTVVSVTKVTGGDADLSASPSSLTFTTANWSVEQFVTVEAKEDQNGDTANGSATFNLAAAGLGTVAVRVNENDNDTTLAGYPAPSQGGSVVIGGTPSGFVTKSAPAAISATANAGYTFTGWSFVSGSGSFADSNSISTTATITNSAVVNANFSTCAAPVGVPSISFLSVTPTSASMRWTTVSGATGYEYQFQPSTNWGATPTVWASPSGPSGVSAAGLSGGSTHFLRVRATNSCGVGNWATNSFTTAMPSISVSSTSVVAPEGSWVYTSQSPWTETRDGSFSVNLSAAPSSPVTISVTSAGDSDLSASPAQLVFDSSNWSAPQLVTVKAAEDNSDKDDGTGTVTLSAAGLASVTVSTREDDNDIMLAVRSNDESLGTVSGGGIITAGHPQGFYAPWTNSENVLRAIPISPNTFKNWTLVSGGGSYGSLSQSTLGVDFYQDGEFVANFERPPCPTLAVVSGISVNSVASTSVTLSWPEVPNAGSYQVELATSTEWSPLVHQIIADRAGVTFNSLSPGTTYYIRIRAQNSCGNLGEWGTASFLTPAPSPSPSPSPCNPDLVAPPDEVTPEVFDNGMMGKFSVTLRWGSVMGAWGYLVEIVEVDGEQVALSRIFALGGATYHHLQKGKVYYAKVYSLSECGEPSTTFTASSEFSMDADPEPSPSPSPSPCSDVIEDDPPPSVDANTYRIGVPGKFSADITWEDSFGASGYIVEIVEAWSGGERVIHAAEGNPRGIFANNTFTYHQFLDGRAYYARVKSLNSCGVVGSAATSSPTFGQPENCPALPAPAWVEVKVCPWLQLCDSTPTPWQNFGGGGRFTGVISWEAVPGVSEYLLEVVEITANGERVVLYQKFNQSAVSATSAGVIYHQFWEGSVYRARVYSLSCGVPSEAAASEDFSAPVTPSPSPSPSPSPCNEVPVCIRVQDKVYNISGIKPTCAVEKHLETTVELPSEISPPVRVVMEGGADDVLMINGQVVDAGQHSSPYYNGCAINAGNYSFDLRERSFTMAAGDTVGVNAGYDYLICFYQCGVNPSPTPTPPPTPTPCPALPAPGNIQVSTYEIGLSGRFSADISWSPVSGVRGYLIEVVEKDGPIGREIFLTQEINSTSLTSHQFNDNRAYFARVYSVSSCGSLSSSPVISIDFGKPDEPPPPPPPPPPPVCISVDFFEGGMGMKPDCTVVPFGTRTVEAPSWMSLPITVTMKGGADDMLIIDGQPITSNHGWYGSCPANAGNYTFSLNKRSFTIGAGDTVGVNAGYSYSICFGGTGVDPCTEFYGTGTSSSRDIDCSYCHFPSQVGVVPYGPSAGTPCYRCAPVWWWWSGGWSWIDVGWGWYWWDWWDCVGWCGQGCPVVVVPCSTSADRSVSSVGGACQPGESPGDGWVWNGNTCSWEEMIPLP
jgi:hypothetical protein